MAAATLWDRRGYLLFHFCEKTCQNFKRRKGQRKHFVVAFCTHSSASPAPPELRPFTVILPPRRGVCGGSGSLAPAFGQLVIPVRQSRGPWDQGEAGAPAESTSPLSPVPKLSLSRGAGGAARRPEVHPARALHPRQLPPPARVPRFPISPTSKLILGHPAHLPVGSQKAAWKALLLWSKEDRGRWLAGPLPEGVDLFPLPCPFPQPSSPPEARPREVQMAGLPLGPLGLGLQGWGDEEV
ncbi:PREDICTED: uncharacterized protein LOC108522772 [Rhinopithecus bieti]|uniref:uncharacterized protein LOC108522772 n=1 Tax=Rhinopithecus bieti TaxID=61621 RepID=UPI00083C1B94|nr:PREDICTED: uncharacterized protein LOC108522772 [Rhinopithecus bieti]